MLARVVELVDTQDLKSCGQKMAVRVQLPSRVHVLCIGYQQH